MVLILAESATSRVQSACAVFVSTFDAAGRERWLWRQPEMRTRATGIRSRRIILSPPESSYTRTVTKSQGRTLTVWPLIDHDRWLAESTTSGAQPHGGARRGLRRSAAGVGSPSAPSSCTGITIVKPQRDRVAAIDQSASNEIFPHLSRAPITEAIIDVRVRAREDLRTSELSAAHSEVQSWLPALEERRAFQARVELRGTRGHASTSDLGVDGYLFWSADRLDLAQFRVDGLSLNRLKPYQSWESWFPRFTDLWDLYVRTARPESVTRIGVRCLNHIVLPQPPFDLNTYLTAPAQYPSELGENVDSFVTNVALWDESDPNLKLTLTQSLQATEAAPAQLILDVDAYSTGDFHPREILGMFGKLHHLRNRAFFRSITSETIALLK